MRKIRVLVADDHTIMRDGICSLLSVAADIEVVGEAANGRETLEKVKELAPDVVILDLAMPIMGGMEATRRIRREFPGTKVLALTQYDDKDFVFPVIEAGASGFICKTAASAELAAGIRSVYRGEAFLSPSVARVLIEDYQQAANSRNRHDPYELLTEREREVLRLLADGHTTLEIAEKLVISPKTVESHKTSLMSKLDIHNRTELIKYAVRKGIIAV